jgi:hypothetical protein
MMNKAPIFLLGAHKSGTSLLRSLFDGHPDLFVMPFEAHFPHLLGYATQYGYSRSKDEPKDRNSFIARAVNAIHHQNISNDPYADAVNLNLFDETLFRQTIEKSDCTDETGLLEAFIQAVHQSFLPLKNQIPLGRMVEKSVSHAEHAEKLRQWFPGARFVYILRNPYANWVALRRYKSHQFGAPVVSKMVRSFSVSYRSLQNIEQHTDVLVVKYEDLLQDTETIMKQVATHCNISWNEILVEPTRNGQKWQGNSTSDKKFEGIDPNAALQYKKYLTPFDTLFVNKLYSGILNKYNFPAENVPGSIWKRLPGEPIKKYVYNRWFYFNMKSFTINV